MSTGVAVSPGREPTERRAVVRQTLYTDLSIIHEGVGRTVELRPPDISRKGLFINTPQVFPVGTLLTVRFRLTACGLLVRVRAIVRYCLEGVGIGVEFVNLSEEARSAIDAGCNAVDW